MTHAIQSYLPENFSEIVSQILAQRVEGLKVDFKRELPLGVKGMDLGELIQDLCSIANTDDPQYFDDAGYLIIGRDRSGQPHPLPEKFDADKLSAALHNQLSKYVTPAINFHVVGPLDHPDGPVALIRIPPSLTQPHIPTREVGDAKANVVLVRAGDSKRLADATDYTRFLTKSLARENAPLRRELDQLQGVIQHQQTQIAELRGIHTPELASSAERLAVQLRSPATTLIREIRGEILRFNAARQKVILDGTVIPYSTLNVPSAAHLLDARSLQGLSDALSGLEAATQPLVELLGYMTQESRFRESHDPVLQAVVVGMAEMTQAMMYAGPSSETIIVNGQLFGALLAYPSVMLLFAAAVASCAFRQPTHLWPFTEVNRTVRRYTNLNGTFEYFPMNHTWFLRPALDWLVHLTDRSYVHSAATQRLRERMAQPDWLGQILPFSEQRRITAQADILVTIGYGVTSLQSDRTPDVISSEWMRYTDATQTLHEWMRTLTAQQVEDLTNREPQKLQEVMLRMDALTNKEAGLMPVHAAQSWGILSPNILAR
ncbi:MULTISPECIES: AlbA family DNA-binding domain-containing protein [unclassified Deinococcus]|uniref:AlbA family DNA-binding domain-containing protein n=1 Tax=unclassified Deinococcus TaxID=2623546 RepID=UPI001C2F9E3F|nr:MULTISPECIES: ATP-binding protein [unclassified Deinococcus]MDK2014428.1 ATP-binding protein [Deinococcus sp. 43]